jgi:hypothetical protein
MALALVNNGDLGSVARAKINASLTMQNNMTVINIVDYGCVPQAWNGTTNSSVGLDAAVAQCNVIYAAGGQPVMYVPPGIYYLMTPPRSFVGPGSIIGEGAYRSVFRLDQTFAGDVFQWSETWSLGGWSGGNTNATGYLQGQIKAGVNVQGIGIWGDRRGTTQQNGLMFYDSNDFVRVKNVALWHLKGYGIASGKTRDFPTRAYLRESLFSDIQIWNSGSGIGGFNVPAFDTDSNANAEGANEVHFNDINIFAPYGTGFRIINSGPGTGTVRQNFINGMRIEAMQTEAAECAGCDLMVLAAGAGMQNNNIRARGIEILSPYSNAAGLRVTADSSTNASYAYDIEGFIAAPVARTGTVGLALDCIRNSRFCLSGLGGATQITVGPASKVTGPVEIDYPSGPDTVSIGWDAAANRGSLVWITPARIGTAIYDPGSLVDGAGATTTIAVLAALGDFAVASFSLDLQGIQLHAWVSATNTVSVRFQNETGSTIDLASGTITVRVTY